LTNDFVGITKPFFFREGGRSEDEGWVRKVGFSA